MADSAPSSTQDQHLGLLAPVDLARLSTLALRARTIVEGALGGVHRNLHPGTSLEFTEHKEYAPGDDVRRIDDKEAFTAARRLAREEGLFAGGSSGAAVHVACELARELV